MMAVRIIVGIYLVIHGFCHLVGFVVPWKIAVLKEEPYKTTLLAGAVDIGDAGIRMVGVLWLLAAAGFAAGAVGVFGQWSWWRPLVTGLSIFSLVLCVLGLPGAKIGIAANAIILVYLIVGGTFGWVPK
ncbi:MAG TPA: ABC transporter permease [Spirochaetota bacterium]|nr:ABC transporter permease [Spirochaetota bacterium]HPC40931.1 ABC transporter permease [Spirochaetota bacterium]HPL16058.1 ABC transporter permease [Spirochaetota bacterium]HQF08639.1 ABC transporter permease [Spirochaetota bacterium]HQH97354.1 ABC transporter permease [Spirochaetota bacterium]